MSKITSPVPFSNSILMLDVDTILFPLTSVPPNCGVVSSTTSLVNDIVSIPGLVPSSAFAYAITVLPLATVAEVPVSSYIFKNNVLRS